MLQGTLRIGQLAAQTGTSVETIRYYEQQNLLPEPARSDGNYRLYGEAHLRRLQFIRHCRSLDMTLDEIRVLLDYRDLPGEDCTGVNTLLDKHIGHVATRIKELKALQAQLKELRNRCVTTRSNSQCGILQGLSGPDDGATHKGEAHKNGCH